MAPKLGEISQIEKLAAAETPSEEGAWWIMLQTAESICNLASLRDPVSNADMAAFWSEAAKGVENFVGQEVNHPLPYDDLMQMVSFCGDQLLEVVKNPRHNLVKADRMVRPERVRETGYKTINWLGRQPGRSVKEKMAGKRTLLTQKKEYSYDIRENQVVRMLYQQLMRRVSDRVNNGAYDESANEQMEQMSRIKKLLRESPLAGVSPKKQSQANNVLLSDKNYSVLWRAYMEMNRFDKRLENRWKQAFELYVKAVFLAVNAKLLSYEDVFVVEDRLRRNDAEELQASYIVGYHYTVPFAAAVKAASKSLSIDIYDIPHNRAAKAMYAKNMEIIFSDAVSKDKLKAHRGTPLLVEIREDGKRKKEIYFADLSCIHELIAFCMETLFSFAGIDPIKVEIDPEKCPEQDFPETAMSASVSFDIMGNGRVLGIADEKLRSVDRFCSDKAVVYRNDDGSSHVCPAGERRIHMKAEEEIAVREAVLSDENRGLKAVLDEIREKITLGQDDHFFYLVPDALEELRQKNLKLCIKSCFTRAFPVWRSVAALETWLADPAYEFAKDSVFAYMDLVGETATAGMMTIHYEEALGKDTCNHFPPFPQIQEGDDITEDAFCRSYVREYAAQKRIDIPEEAIEGLVGDNSIRALILEKSDASYFYMRDGKICRYQIRYVDKIVKKCVSIWLYGIHKFWNRVSPKFGRNKVHYVYFISDLLFRYVTEDDLYRIFTKEQWDNIRGIFQSSTGQMLEGALVYQERIHKHLPLWTEYLPKLSLKIPVEGKYEDWDLIDDDRAFDVMRDDAEFPVKEQRPLRLHAGASEYYFELKKEDISRRPSRMEAHIPFKGKLESDVDVNLFIRYKYGYDNSYELILRPVEKSGAPFQEIAAEWRSGYREKRNVGGPKFPALRSSAEVERDVDLIRTSMIKTEKTIAAFLGHRYDHARVSERFKFDQISKFLTINTFKLRDTLRYYERNEAVRELVEQFFHSELYRYCYDLLFLEHPQAISADFIEDYRDSDELKKLRDSAAGLLYSFGVYVPEQLQQYLICNYHSLCFEHKQSILFNLVYKNTENDAVWNLLLELFQKKPYSTVVNIRNLSNLCWCDEKMIPKLGLYPALVGSILSKLTKELQNMRRISDAEPTDKAARKRYLSMIEVILAILRLREEPAFDILTAGSKDAVELADLIREVDDVMGNPESRIKLLVSKPDALHNMSNIAYAIDMYLTGNEGVDSIEVLSVESDE